IFREYKPLTVAQNIGCEPVDTPITLANPQYRKIVYVSDNNGQIIRHAVEKDVASKTFDTRGRVGQNGDVPAWFRSSDGDASCKDVIVARQARPYIDSSHIDLQSGFDLTGSFTLYAVRQGQGPKDSTSYSTDIIDSPGTKCQTG